MLFHQHKDKQHREFPTVNQVATPHGLDSVKSCHWLYPPLLLALLSNPPPSPPSQAVDEFFSTLETQKIDQRTHHMVSGRQVSSISLTPFAVSCLLSPVYRRRRMR